MLRHTFTAVSVWRFDFLSANTDAFWSSTGFQGVRLCVGLLGRWLQHFYLICLWFSLPLSIWLSSGWVGLFVQWRAICGVSCLAKQNLCAVDAPPVLTAKR